MGGSRPWLSRAAAIVSPLVDFLYPPVCLLCTEALFERTAALCPACWDAFPPAAPSDPAWVELSSALRADGVEEFLARWVYDTEGKLHDAIHLVKYRRERVLAERMAEALGRCVAGDARFAGGELLVPVPLHRARLRERTFNQSLVLAEGVARATGWPIAPDALVRRGRATSQTRATAEERRRNVAEAFEPGPESGKVAGRVCVVVDDVVTTGATASACGALLRSAGASSVHVACAAMAR